MSKQADTAKAGRVLGREGSSGHEYSDEDLIAEIQARRPEALERLYDRYQRLVTEVASGILPDRDDAEETLQDVFTEVWNRAEQFDPRRGKVKGWISGITRCRAIDRYRKVRRCMIARQLVCDRIELNTSEHVRLSTQSVGVAEAVSDERRLLRGLIGNLPPEQAQVISLAYLHEMSQREIAEEIGTTLGVVKHRLILAMRGMNTMADQLREIFRNDGGRTNLS